MIMTVNLFLNIFYYLFFFYIKKIIKSKLYKYYRFKILIEKKLKL